MKQKGSVSGNIESPGVSSVRQVQMAGEKDIHGQLTASLQLVGTAVSFVNDVELFGSLQVVATSLAFLNDGSVGGGAEHPAARKHRALATIRALAARRAIAGRGMETTGSQRLTVTPASPEASDALPGTRLHW